MRSAVVASSKRWRQLIGTRMMVHKELRAGRASVVCLLFLALCKGYQTMGTKSVATFCSFLALSWKFSLQVCTHTSERVPFKYSPRKISRKRECGWDVGTRNSPFPSCRGVRRVPKHLQFNKVVWWKSFLDRTCLAWRRSQKQRLLFNVSDLINQLLDPQS